MVYKKIKTAKIRKFLISKLVNVLMCHFSVISDQGSGVSCHLSVNRGCQCRQLRLAVAGNGAYCQYSSRLKACQLTAQGIALGKRCDARHPGEERVHTFTESRQGFYINRIQGCPVHFFSPVGRLISIEMGFVMHHVFLP